jgi:hypothetical protein
VLQHAAAAPSRRVNRRLRGRNSLRRTHRPRVLILS